MFTVMFDNNCFKNKPMLSFKKIRLGNEHSPVTRKEINVARQNHWTENQQGIPNRV